MRSRKTSRVLTLGVAAGVLVAACSGVAPSAAPTNAPSQAPSSVAATSEPGALPKPEMAEIQIASSSNEISDFAIRLAIKKGIFEKYGIKATYSIFEGDALVSTALQSGQIQFASLGTSSAFSSHLTDTPYDIVSVTADRLTDALVCKSGIDTADEVKGKSIAISTFGGTSNAAALLALKALNLSADAAVITQVGGQSARIAALEGGSIDCAIIDSTLNSQMTGEGFSIATDLSKVDVPFGRSGVAALEDFIKANPNTVLVTVAAILEGQNEIWKDPDGAAAAFAADTGISVDDAKAQVQDFLNTGDRSCQWPDEALLNAQKPIAIVNPDIIEVQAADVGDHTFLQQLADNGFYDKIGSPLP